MNDPLGSWLEGCIATPAYRVRAGQASLAGRAAQRDDPAMPKTSAIRTGRSLAFVSALCAMSVVGCQSQSSQSGASDTWAKDRTAAETAAGTAAPRASTATAAPRPAAAPVRSGAAPTFRQSMDQVMPHLGAGNWIVIADASFPKSTHPGWKTVPMNVNPTDALADVIASAQAYGHVKPKIWLDREIFVVSDAHVPGITEFRETIEMRSANLTMDAAVLHAEHMNRLREIAKLHRVLVIKTPGMLPYSTIYVELQPANWTPEQEAALRAHMANHP